MPKHDVFTFLYVVKMTFFTFWYSPVCRLSRHQRYACYSCCWRLSITLNDATSFQSINQSIDCYGAFHPSDAAPFQTRYIKVHSL